MIANDILVIADKPRIQHLLDGVEPAWGGSVIIVSSLAAAEEHLEGGTVGLLIIQDRLSGLSHELLVRHVRSLVGEREVMIACAGDDPDIHDPEIHHLDLSLPDRDLVRQIGRLTARLPRPDLSPFRGIPPVGEPDAPEPESEERKGDPPPLPDPADTSGRPPVATRFEAELETELARLEEVSPPPPDEPVPSVDDLLRAPSSPSESRRAPLIAVLILLAAAAGVWYLLHGTKSLTSSGVKSPPLPTPVQKPRSTAAARPQAAPPRPSAALSLPPFLARENPRHDPAYASSKPGWERYETASAEFRIYAPRGEVTALQVISRTPDGLSPALFSRALRELAGVRDYRTRERQLQGEYLVKRGTLGDRGRVTIYKDRDDRRLHAFVIDRTEGGARNP